MRPFARCSCRPLPRRPLDHWNGTFNPLALQVAATFGGLAANLQEGQTLEISRKPSVPSPAHFAGQVRPSSVITGILLSIGPSLFLIAFAAILERSLQRCVVTYGDGSDAGNSNGVADSRPPERPKQPGQPRKRKDVERQGDGSSDNDLSLRTPSKKSRKADSTPPRPLACPFWKLNPIRNIDCLLRHNPRDISALKLHFERDHKVIYCPICGGTFVNINARDEHIREQSCQRRSFVLEGVTEQHFERMRFRPEQSESDKWFAIWRILFPGIRAPVCPYWEDKLEDFLGVIRRSVIFFPNVRWPTSQQLRLLGRDRRDLTVLTSDFPPTLVPPVVNEAAFSVSDASFASNFNPSERIEHSSIAQSSALIVSGENLSLEDASLPSAALDLRYSADFQEGGIFDYMGPFGSLTSNNSFVDAGNASSQVGLHSRATGGFVALGVSGHDANCAGNGDCNCMGQSSLGGNGDGTGDGL